MEAHEENNNQGKHERKPSNWKSALRKSMCCDILSPTSSPKGFPERKILGNQYSTMTRFSCKRRGTSDSPCPPLESWAHRSYEAAEDAFSAKRGVLGSADAKARMIPLGAGTEAQHFSETEKSERPVSEAVSALDSRASLFTQYSVSELGVEAEPPWLLEATLRNDVWPRHDPHVWELPGWVPTDPAVKDSGVDSVSYRSPRAQRLSHQNSSRSKPSPKVTIQTSMAQAEQWPEKRFYKPTNFAQKEHPLNVLPPQPSFLPRSAPAPCAPLTALLYFALELPCSSPHHSGGYLRHYVHPMRLPLSTPQQVTASIAHLRGYLTQQTARFLSHFGSSHTPKATSGDARLVVHFPGLFRHGSYDVERIWGPELAWAWLDASEEGFAEAVVGVLRAAAERAIRQGKGGMVDVLCVSRKVVDGRRGYGLLMDVRRIGEETRREQRNKAQSKDQGPYRKASQSAGMACQ